MDKQLSEVKPGDSVLRNMMGIKMTLNVTALDDKLIHCGPWTFDRITGEEVDEDLSISPSYIRPL